MNRLVARYAIALPLCVSFTHLLNAQVQAASPATIAAVSAALASSNPVADAPSLTTPLTAEELSPWVQTYREHLTFLANPFMEGRAPKSRGGAIAVEYLEYHLKVLGLEPAFNNRESYRQTFRTPVAARPGDGVNLKTQSASYSAKGKPVDLVPGTDVVALGFSGNAKATGPLAFAGYGINNERRQYYSYPEGTDLAGKIVMIFRFEPMDEKGKSKWAESRWSFAAGLDPKVREAIKLGAAGIIIVNPPEADDPRTARMEGLELGEPGKNEIPVMMMSSQAADALVRAGDQMSRSLLDLRKEADEAGGVTVFPDTQVTLEVEVERTPILTDNVGAILPGRGDLANEFIVIGAHYDHVGFGYYGSRAEFRGKLHPGADDNASGTSGTLLLAKQLAKAFAEAPKDQPARSVLFLFFGAEESGLHGSRYYANNPITPIETHRLMINLDMIGRLREGRVDVGGVATGVGMDEFLKPYWDSSGLTIKALPRGPSNSDHASFYAKKVPVLFFFTGLHKDYHTPTDTIDTVNMEGGATVAELAYRIALETATKPTMWTFSEGGSTASANQNNPGPVGGMRVRFGIGPGNYGDDKPGVLVESITSDDSPAAKAGLKVGDVITHWNDAEVKSIEDWTAMLMKHEPGDKVKIKYLRDGKTAETEATLTARGRPNS